MARQTLDLKQVVGRSSDVKPRVEAVRKLTARWVAEMVRMPASREACRRQRQWMLGASRGSLAQRRLGDAGAAGRRSLAASAEKNRNSVRTVPRSWGRCKNPRSRDGLRRRRGVKAGTDVPDGRNERRLPPLPPASFGGLRWDLKFVGRWKNLEAPFRDSCRGCSVDKKRVRIRFPCRWK